jgi:hypothetical protein
VSSTSAINGTTNRAESISAVATLPSTYSVEALPNGKFRVPNVPIFAEHERDLGDGKTFTADVKWLAQAVANMNRRSASGSFNAPVHFGHNDPRSTQERPSAGIFEAPRLRRALYENKPALILFADFVLDSSKDVEKLKKYRYRSVEIKNLNGEPKIDSVALLQSRSPYFKFPNLELDPASAALAYEADGGVGGAFHWPTPLHFQEDSMAGENPTAQTQGGSDAKLDQMLALLQKLVGIFDAPVPSAAPAAAPVMQSAEPAKAPLPVVAAASPALPATTHHVTVSTPVTLTTSAPGNNGATLTYVEPVVAFAQKAAAAAQASTKVRDEAITWAERELSDRPTGNATELRGLLEVQYSQGGRPAVETAVAVMKTMLPSLPSANAHADARLPAAKDELEARYADDPIALEVIADVRALKTHLPAKYRNDSLELFIEADPRMEGRIRPAPGARS